MSSDAVDRTTDRDAGLWAGRSVARCFLSPDGFVVLVGRSARDNDLLTFKLAAANDAWLHIASGPGSHVVIRNPDKVDPIPRDTIKFAASLAARYSSAKKGGKTAVHLAQRGDVSKPRAMPQGRWRCAGTVLCKSLRTPTSPLNSRNKEPRRPSCGIPKKM